MASPLAPTAGAVAQRGDRQHESESRAPTDTMAQLNWPETYSFVSCSRGSSNTCLVGPDSTR